ncbi:unnamed protein product [Peniophora sp. CBMAI 1063]|nr:unnamed protein product [Peniophora sp. CBMAI 1063]
MSATVSPATSFPTVGNILESTPTPSETLSSPQSTSPPPATPDVTDEIESLRILLRADLRKLFDDRWMSKADVISEV